MTAHKGSWMIVGHIEDIPLRGARVVKTPAGCIALFRSAEDQVFALDDRCPHRGGPLSQGIVHGNSVTCPLHSMVIALDTGEALGADKGAVKTYPVRVENGMLMLESSQLGSRDAA